MLKIDRMEIDDAGGNPSKLAHSVLKQIPDLKPRIPVREIAFAVGIYEIREEPLVGIEGGLIAPDDKSEGAILVNLDRPEKRKRYTIGHELGHYLNPWHKPAAQEGFRCSPKDMAVEAFRAGDRAAQMEVEANQFAAELLMPAGLVNGFLRRLSGIDIDHILSMSEDFRVSREAAARRYVALHDDPAAVIFSKDGVIRYIKKHPHFPAIEVWSRDPLPAISVSARSRLQVGQISDWDAVDAGVWLRDPKGRQICEQTLAQRNGFRLTLITLAEIEDEDDGGDEDWAPPTFHR